MVSSGMIMGGLILLLALFVVFKGIFIIKQAEVVVVERLGRYNKTLTSGLNIIIPFFEAPREISWRHLTVDPDRPGRSLAVPIRATRIDLRETVMDFPRQSVITRDNVTVEINALLYFQVTDPFKAVYQITNLPDAIEKLTQTTLRNVVGELDLDQTLTSRDTINDKLRAILDTATDKWGVKINRVELQDISPPPQIREDMEKQMRAERERRALVLSAEGEKRAAILTAEGERESAIATAEGEKQSQILTAQGLAQARLVVADAEAEAIGKIINAVGTSETSVQYLVAVRYIEALERIANSPQKTVFMPYEASAVLGSLGSMKELLKHAENA
ncbi:MAG: SPFH domain-containing protein [Myxococcota bacterium]|nr:SPFH domain-containing protein [Myxococcota bacterium]